MAGYMKSPAQDLSALISSYLEDLRHDYEVIDNRSSILVNKSESYMKEIKKPKKYFIISFLIIFLVILIMVLVLDEKTNIIFIFSNNKSKILYSILDKTLSFLIAPSFIALVIYLFEKRNNMLYHMLDNNVLEKANREALNNKIEVEKIVFKSKDAGRDLELLSEIHAISFSEVMTVIRERDLGIDDALIEPFTKEYETIRNIGLIKKYSFLIEKTVDSKQV